MISQEQIKHIAKLARIALNADEEKQLSNDLGKILDYIQQLQQVDVSNVNPSFHAIDQENVLRPDIAVESNKQEAIISQFPESQAGFNKVKSIFENNDN